LPEYQSYSLTGEHSSPLHKKGNTHTYNKVKAHAKADGKMSPVKVKAAASQSVAQTKDKREYKKGS